MFLPWLRIDGKPIWVTNAQNNSEDSCLLCSVVESITPCVQVLNKYLTEAIQIGTLALAISIGADCFF